MNFRPYQDVVLSLLVSMAGCEGGSAASRANATAARIDVSAVHAQAEARAARDTSGDDTPAAGHTP